MHKFIVDSTVQRSPESTDHSGNQSIEDYNQIGLNTENQSIVAKKGEYFFSSR